MLAVDKLPEGCRVKLLNCRPGKGADNEEAHEVWFPARTFRIQAPNANLHLAVEVYSRCFGRILATLRFLKRESESRVKSTLESTEMKPIVASVAGTHKGFDSLGDRRLVQKIDGWASC